MADRMPSHAAALSRPRLALVALSLVAAAACAALMLPGKAVAGNQISHFKSFPTTTQAGGHPDIMAEVQFGSRIDTPSPCNCTDGRAVTVHMPTGVIGSPHSAPRCTLSDFSAGQCPVSSQVGYVWLQILGLIKVRVPVYNMIPHPDEPGLMAFFIPILNAAGFMEFTSRTETDYGLDVTSAGFHHLLPVDGLAVKLWGVPASPANDPIRAPFEFNDICQVDEPDGICGPPVPSDAPEAPFLSNPTTCGQSLVVVVDVLSYDGETTHAQEPWPATTGCEQLTFNPSMTALPTTTAADSASGIDVSLRAPQTQSPTVPSPSQLRETVVHFPEGFSVNPNAADGKSSCTDAQAKFGTREAAACPETAKVGTIEIHNAALPAALPGGIYLGEPKPGDKYRLIITGDGFGTHVKLPGSIKLDPATGRMTVSFPDLPQTPLEGFDMHFFGSERGLLATPTQCGTYSVEAEFTPWNAALQKQTSTSTFEITSGPRGAPCPPGSRPFNPGLVAGSNDNTAGAASRFLLRVDRADGDQNLVKLDTLTPPGFLASLAGVPYCPESALATVANPAYSGVTETATPACPAASRIGTVYAATGAGEHPLNSPGSIYLAGPYRGAPLSLMIVVPGVSGPFDLGNVAVRTAVRVDPRTAQLRTDSDPIPMILDGIPLRIRSLHFDFDRPGFTLNPTSCRPFSVTAAMTGDGGAQVAPRVHYQVANCADLGFAPKLGLRLKGSTKRRGHPALTAVVRMRRNDANISRATVTMPRSLLLDNAHIGTVCTRARFAARNCPPASRYGDAVAVTPLLDRPLRGGVYLRSSNRKLPDLVADLRGQVDLELVGRIDSPRGKGLRTRFEAVPDAPVSRFTLKMAGGKKGLLVNSVNLCKSTPKADVAMVGQNRASLSRTIKIGTGCRSKGGAR